MNSTYENAKRCPKCKEPGEETRLTNPPRDARLPVGTKIATIYCRNDRCKWFNTMWIVQINPDGTVPDPKDHTKSPKIYVGVEGHNEIAANLIETLKRNAEAELQPGTEIRRPY